MKMAGEQKLLCSYYITFVINSFFESQSIVLSLRLHLRNSKQLLQESTEFSIKLCLSIYAGYSVAVSAVAVLLACPCGPLCVSTKG